ncbi:hypothetical protein HS088_TW17G00605 [Tripterygium wilfordii]|uniref:Malectin-like domain-containing protein n=1 Tax=Tripterygium wilfordii TaxID=458696 RepID=A0A7J7CG98_TRIWF|nr:probable receptor-like protein kinase At5g24010 [Tripterygium wilfordii]KAF5733069.1 hypothetical protein HS088_TW17G00605 [Tripterygium wilfordii]
MEIPGVCLLILSLSILFNLSFFALASFSPIDNHLIDCGSTVDSIVDTRRFTADASNSAFLSHTRSIPLTVQNPSPDSPNIYRTARVFTRPAKYLFSIRDRGTHMVRLHFHGFSSPDFVPSDAQFHVVVNEYVVLSNFSNRNDMNPRIVQYLIWVDSDKLVISFIPTMKSKYAYVNAIEVISAPKDLVADTAQVVKTSQAVDGYRVEMIDGLTKLALETVYRINVGGPKLTPFNDTLWRTWVPDDEFFRSNELSKLVYFSSPIRYQIGGASREVGPDFVYKTARVIRSTNASIWNKNMTWEFPVVQGYKYLLRLHFCDIASISLGLIYFNVYVNEYLAYYNLDLSYVTNGMLASPFYVDFVVDGDKSGILTLSVGPSNKSMSYAVDGILNGVELMKMNNSVGSLDGDLCAKSVLKSWSRGNIGLLVPLVAVLCLLLSISLLMQRRTVSLRDSVAWSKLPLDVPEVNSKHDSLQLSAKV